MRLKPKTKAIFHRLEIKPRKDMPIGAGSEHPASRHPVQLDMSLTLMITGEFADELEINTELLSRVFAHLAHPEALSCTECSMNAMAKDQK